MAEIVNICGKNYTIFSEDQYLRILEDVCGRDVVDRHLHTGNDYIRYDELEENPLMYCPGECLKYHEKDLREICEDLREIDKHMNNTKIQELIKKVVYMINNV